MVRLYRVILPVKDIEQAELFYGHVLGVQGERVSPGRHYFDCGGTILACYDPEADGDLLGDGWKHHPNQYIYFSVKDLEGVYERVKTAGAKELEPIADTPWGERLFYAQDPFGNPICFVEATTVFTGLKVKRAELEFPFATET